MHHTEELFSENTELFRNLFYYMYEPLAICEIIFDQNGEPYDYRHLEVNSAFEIFIGIAASALLGNRREFGEPDPYWLELFGQVVKTGEPGAREVYSSGSGKWCDLRAISLDGGKFAFIFMDITKNKLADEALRESEVKYRTLFETMDEGFALCELVRDSQGKVIDYRALSRMDTCWNYAPVRWRPASPYIWSIISRNWTAGSVWEYSPGAATSLRNYSTTLPSEKRTSR